MGELTKSDYSKLRTRAVGLIVEAMGDATDEQWDAPTYCAGWKARDIVAHMVSGYLTHPAKLVPLGLRYGSPAKTAQGMARKFAERYSNDELLTLYEREGSRLEPSGLAKVIPQHEAMVDHIVHRSDILRPQGRPSPIPEDYLRAALDAAPGIGGFIGAKKRAKGLRLTATDVDWTWGDGPEVRGPGEALLLALTGRPAGLAECRSEGVAALAATQGVDGSR